jgi:ABC-type glutathione transport system ATPase component
MGSSTAIIRPRLGADNRANGSPLTVRSGDHRRCACPACAARGRATPRLGSRASQIGGLLDRKPSQLSRGQRQRVAIGRALVQQAKVFLLDEPLSNLDAKLRTEMRVELKRLHRSLGAMIIYVTLDMSQGLAFRPDDGAAVVAPVVSALRRRSGP